MSKLGIISYNLIFTFDSYVFVCKEPFVKNGLTIFQKALLLTKALLVTLLK